MQSGPTPEDIDATVEVSAQDPLKILEGYYVQKKFWASWVLIGINCLVFLAMVVASNGSAFLYASRSTVIDWGACAPSLVLNEDPWRIFTAAFVHVSVFHLAVNMFVLWDVGRYIERLAGTMRFLIIYCFCAIGASLFSLLAHPYQVSAGASGAVLGLWGAFLSFFINNQSTLPKKLVLSTMRFVPVFVFIAVVTGTFIPDVDNAAHAGGFIIGAFCGVFLLQAPSRPVKAPVTIASLLAVAGLLFTLYRVDQMRPFDFEHKYEYDRAITLIDRHDAKQALAMLNKHIATNPDAVDGYVMRAHINERMDNWEGAEKDATKILELHGPAQVAYALRAEARNAKGDYANAMADADETIKIAPTLSKPYTVRIQALKLLERYEEALAEATVEKSPPLSESILHRLRGDIYWAQGDDVKARQEYDAAVNSGQTLEAALSARAQFLLASGDYKQCAEDATRVLTMAGWDSRQVAYNAILAAEAYRGAGDATKANEIMSRVETRVKDKWQSKLVAFVGGKMTASELLAAVSDDDEKTEANTYVAVEWLRAGKIAEARELLEWVVKSGNKSFIEYPLSRALLRGIREELLKKNGGTESPPGSN